MLSPASSMLKVSLPEPTSVSEAPRLASVPPAVGAVLVTLTMLVPAPVFSVVVEEIDLMLTVSLPPPVLTLVVVPDAVLLKVKVSLPVPRLMPSAPRLE